MVSYVAIDRCMDIFDIRKKLIQMLEREKRIDLFKRSMEVIPVLVDMEIAGYKLSTFEH